MKTAAAVSTAEDELYDLSNFLDTSADNSLINFRPSDSAVKIMPPDLSRIENKLSGSGLRICAVPRGFEPHNVDDKIFEPDDEKQNISAIADAELKNHRLRAYREYDSLEVRMAELCAAESDTCTICAALGFLKWYESENSDTPRYAPLVVMPVNIIRQPKDIFYTIKISDMGAQLNLTLAEMLKQDFGLDIPELRTFPDDGGNIDVWQVFQAVREAVAGFGQWDVCELMFVGKFRFGDLAVWDYFRSYAVYGSRLGVSADRLRYIGRNTYDILRDEFENLFIAASDFGDVRNTSLRRCPNLDYSDELRDDLGMCLLTLKNAVLSLANDVNMLCEFSGKKIMTLRQYDYAARMIIIASQNIEIIENIVICSNWDNVAEDVISFVNMGINQELLKNYILRKFDSSVLKLKLPKTVTPDMYDKMIKKLNGYAKEHDFVHRGNVGKCCRNINILRKMTASIQGVPLEISRLFGTSVWMLNGEETKWDIVELSVELSEKLRKLMIDSPFLRCEKQKLFKNLMNYYGTIEKKLEIKHISNTLIYNFCKFSEAFNALAVGYNMIPCDPDSYLWQREITSAADNIVAELPKLEQWTDIISICGKIAEISDSADVEGD